MKESWAPIVPDQDITPERALWCCVILTFLEDMNHLVDLKLWVLQSHKKIFSVSNMGLDASGVYDKERLLTLIQTRMRKLIFMAKSPYTELNCETIGLAHSQLVRTLEYQARDTAKVKLNFMMPHY